MMKIKFLPLLASIAVAAPQISNAATECMIGGVPLRHATAGDVIKQSAIDALERSYGEDMMLMRIYGNFSGVTQQMRDNFVLASSNDFHPYLRINPTGAGGIWDVYRDIAAGEWDTVINEYVQFTIDWIKQNDRKWVMIGFADEMNGNWKSYVIQDFGRPNGPENFILAWRYIHNKFRTKLANQGVSANKVKFVFNPSRNTGSGKPLYQQIKSFYPGNEYVDYAITNLFVSQENFVNHLPSNSIISAYAEAGADVKPFGFGEIGVERPTEPEHTDRTNWIANNISKGSFQTRDVAFFEWFDEDIVENNEYWALTTDSSAKNALRANLNDPFFVSE